MIKLSRTHTLAGIALMLGLVSGVQAATWSKTATTGVAAGSTCNTAGAVSCKMNNSAADGSNATVTGWANIGTSGGSYNGTFRAATLTNQNGSGLGLNHGNTSQDPQEGGDPEHAIDNNGRTDAVLFSFAKSTILESVQIGWSYGDTDFTVLRWVGGAGGPTMSNFSINGGTQNMLGNGWALVGNYDYSGSGSFDINSPDASSSHWLIMAYNSAFGTVSGIDGGDDYFKLLGVSGKTSTGVSEPGAFALAGFALLGAGLARRRKR